MTAAPVRPRSGRSSGWLTRNDCDLGEFRAVVEVETDASAYPHADRVERGVLFYGETLADDVATPEGRSVAESSQ